MERWNKKAAYRLQELRKLAGYSRRDFAKETGYTEAAILSYETARRVPSAKFRKVAFRLIKENIGWVEHMEDVFLDARPFEEGEENGEDGKHTLKSTG